MRSVATNMTTQSRLFRISYYPFFREYFGDQPGVKQKNGHYQGLQQAGEHGQKQLYFDLNGDVDLAMVSEEAAQRLSGSGGFISDLREGSASLLGLLARIKV